MDDLLGGSSTLNCIYFAMTAAGVVFALTTLLLGELLDGDLGADVDTDTDFTGVGDLRIFSPITVATFVTVFGAAGLISTLGLGVSPLNSLVIAFAAAALLSLLVAFVYSRILETMQGSVNIRQADMVGAVGQVTTPIPADGLGEALIEIANERYIKAARSLDHTPIPRGTTIEVAEVVSGVLVVRPRNPS